MQQLADLLKAEICLPARQEVADLGARRRLPQLAGADSLEALTARLEQTQQQVYALFQALVEKPATPYLGLADSLNTGS